jgi:hypothetical protein
MVEVKQDGSSLQFPVSAPAGSWHPSLLAKLKTTITPAILLYAAALQNFA